MDCEKMDLVSYVKNEFTDQERISVAQHLTSCNSCSKAVNEITLILSNLKKVELLEPPANFAEFVTYKVEGLYHKPATYSHVPAWAFSVAVHLLAFGLLALFFVKTEKPKIDIAYVKLLDEQAQYYHIAYTESNLEQLPALKGLPVIETSPDEPVLRDEMAIKQPQLQGREIQPEKRPLKVDPAWYESKVENRILAFLKNGQRDKARDKLRQSFDKNGDMARSVGMALRWLSNNQLEDGSWNPENYGGKKEYTIGITSLCLLTFLFEGNTHIKGQYSTTVAKGTNFLLSQQNEDGFLGSRTGNYMYNHGIASIYLLELYMVTKDTKLEAPCARAVEFIISSQSADGGWGYGSRAAISDISVTVWQVTALRLAHAAGIRYVVTTITKAKGRILDLTDEEGMVGYRARGQYPHGYTSLTSMGMVANLMSSYLVDKQLLKKQAELVTGAGTIFYRDQGHSYENDIGMLYFGSLALFQLDERQWEGWLARFKDALLSRQNKDGSWPQELDKWSLYGGGLYSTAMSTLILQSYYRFPAL